jgi:WD40 repeat protein/DNA-binding SARP family transcriptional activator
MLELRLLGQFDLRLDGDVLDIPSRPAQSLLAFLVLNAGILHRRELLSGMLWPGSTEANARGYLRHALWRIRTAFEACSRSWRDYLQADDIAVRFRRDSPYWLDAHVLLQRKDPSAWTVDQLIAAVSLYRGELLPGFYDEWTILEREHLRALFDHKMELLLERLIDGRRWREVSEWAEYWISRGFVPEPAYRAVLLARAALGDRTGEAESYQRYVVALDRELGLEPTEEMQALHEQLRSDKVLSAARLPPSLEEAQLVDLPPAPGDPPFKGLQHFDVSDADLFFGREALTAKLVADLRQGTNLLVVVGASGSGKSSLLRAGLVPALKQSGPLADGTLPPAGNADCLVRIISPTAHPIQSLNGALSLPPCGKGKPPEDGWGPERVPRRIDHLLVACGAPRLLLVVDQFEELFTLCRVERERAAFIESLLAAAGADSRATIVLALRADFYAHCVAYADLRAALEKHQVCLGPMSAHELRSAIEGPASRGEWQFQPGLVDLLLSDLGGEPGALPLLSHALLETWCRRSGRTLTLKGYAGTGGVRGAIARTAETVYNHRLTEHQQSIARSIFLRLTELGEKTQDTRRRAALSELVPRPQDTAAVEEVLEILAGARLITLAEGSAEVAHEALIREWPTLRQWLDEDRVGIRIHQHLAEAARGWEELGRDPGELYRGSRLAQAQEWAREHADRLNEQERAFLDFSQAQEREQEAEREARQQREVEAAQRLAAAERRRRNVLQALAAVLILATALSLVLTAYSVRQRRAAQEAYSVSLAAHAQRALDERDTVTGLALAMTASSIDRAPLQVQRILLDAAYSPGARRRFDVQHLFQGVEGLAMCLDIDPRGESALLGLADGTIILWNMETGEQLQRFAGHLARVNDVTFSPDGRFALSGGDDAQVILWDISAGQELRRCNGHSGAVRAVDIGPDGHQAVSGGLAKASFDEPGELILWDLDTCQEIRRFEGHLSGVVAANLSPDGRTLLASSGDAELFTNIGTTDEGSTIRSTYFDLLLWDAETGEVLRSFEGMEHDVFTLAIHPGGATALAGSYYNGVASLWNLATGQRMQTLEGEGHPVRTLAFSPDGRTAISGSSDGSLIAWNLDTGAPIVDLRAHDAALLDAAFTPDGRRALSTSRDGTLILWDLYDAAQVQLLVGNTSMVYDVASTSDGKRALSCSGPGGPATLDLQPTAAIRLWNLETGQELRSMELPFGTLFQVAVSPDGRTALVSSPEPFVRIVDLESWAEIGRLEGHQGWVSCIEFTPDGRRALSGSPDGSLILWDVASRQIIYRLTARGPGVWALDISPDGRTALCDAGDNSGAISMILWDLETGKEIRTFVRPDVPEGTGVSGIAYLPGGRAAISCESDGFLIEWDLETGKEVRRLGRHRSVRTRVAVSPDGRLALSSGLDGTLMLWDLTTGALVRNSGGHGAIFDLALTPDGQTALFGSSNTTIVQWQLADPPLNELREWIEANRYVRDLTCQEREQYRVEPLCDEAAMATGAR